MISKTGSLTGESGMLSSILILTIRPIGSSLPRNLFTNVWFTTATLRALFTSVSDRSRPSVVGINLRQPPRDHLYVGLRLLYGDAGLQLRLSVPVIAVGVRGGAVHRPGNPEVWEIKGETLRHDPDQRCRRPVERESLAQNARVLVEALDPQFVGHHEDRRRVRPGVVRHDDAT